MKPAKTPEPRQTQEEDHEQEDINGHTNPRCLKWGEERSLKSKDKASLPCCQASGRDARIIHRTVGECLY